MVSYQHYWFAGKSIDLACSKIVCVGKNYADHISEMNSATPKQPVLFIKPPTALCDANAPIKISHLAHLGEMHHEIEIAVLIGDNLKSNNIADRIVGLGLGIDLTLRDIQSDLKEQGLPWERAKSFDLSCPISGFLPNQQDTRLDNLSLQIDVNGITKQASHSSLMLNSIPDLLHEIDECFTLLPGDIVLTGTPAGVGPLSKGDTVSAKLDNIVMFEHTPII